MRPQPRRLLRAFALSFALGGLVAPCAVVGFFILPPYLGFRTASGRATTWHLRDGTRVRFFKRDHASPGKDSVKVLEVTPPGGTPREYPFATWHGGYGWVELRASDDESVVRLVDTGCGAGCTLDLTTGRLTDEGGPHPPTAKTLRPD